MITLPTDVMSLALDKLYQAVDKKVGLEELRTVQIKAKGGFMVMAARNRTAGGQAHISQDVHSNGEFYFGLSAGYLKDIVSKMEKGGQIKIALDGQHAVISDAQSRFRLNYYTEIPPLEDLFLDYAPVDISKLISTFEKVYFSKTNENINSSIKGVYINNEHIVSTNRFVLNIARNDVIKVKTPIRIGEESVKRMIGVFSKLGEEGGAYDNPHAFALHAGGFYFRTLLLPESYPNYKKLIPKKAPSLCVIDKSKFNSAIERVLILAGDGTVNIEIDNQNMILRSNGQHGNSTETLECESNLVASLSLKGSFLLDTLSRLDEDMVSMEVRKNKPDGSPEMVIIQEEGFTSAIAPVNPNSV